MFVKYQSPLGELNLVVEGGFLTKCKWCSDDCRCDNVTFDESKTLIYSNRYNNIADADVTVLNRVITQLDEYFAGVRRTFDLPLKPEGSEFCTKVWQELMKVEHGATITYGQLAARIRQPKAARAIGRAVHVNPIAIIIPCHRVIGADGSLTGYAGGLDRKLHLLTLESK